MKVTNDSPWSCLGQPLAGQAMAHHTELQADQNTASQKPHQVPIFFCLESTSRTIRARLKNPFGKAECKSPRPSYVCLRNSTISRTPAVLHGLPNLRRLKGQSWLSGETSSCTASIGPPCCGSARSCVKKVLTKDKEDGLHFNIDPNLQRNQ